MKTLLSILLASTFIFSSWAWARPKPGAIKRKRQAVQQKRIRKGVKSGEITKKEARKLKREQKIIQKEVRDAKEDGVITPKEKAKIKHMQNKASKDIYEEKHDEEKRPKAE